MSDTAALLADVEMFKESMRKIAKALHDAGHIGDRTYLWDGVASLAAERDALRADAQRYRWLRDHKCCELSLSRDGDHACNYMTAEQWIAERPDDFADDDPEEVQRMRETNTIWRLQIYPDTPIGFNLWNGATLDSAIDAAMQRAE